MLCKLLWINPVGSILIQWCCSYWFYSLKILFLVLGRKTSKSDWYSFCHLGRNYSWCVSVIHFKISGMLGTVLLSVSIYLYKRSKQKKKDSSGWRCSKFPKFFVGISFRNKSSPVSRCLMCGSPLSWLKNRHCQIGTCQRPHFSLGCVSVCYLHWLQTENMTWLYGLTCTEPNCSQAPAEISVRLIWRLMIHLKDKLWKW